MNNEVMTSHEKHIVLLAEIKKRAKKEKMDATQNGDANESV